MTFSELGVDSRILKAIEELGYETPMPVQAEVLPVLLNEDTDIVALAQTGTGKTAAFGIPTIQKLDYENPHTEALVLCPTRELCMQITNDLQNYSKYISACSVVAVYGGASIEIQKRQLKKGAKIIVATPGRIIDLLNRGYVDLSHTRYTILDEADEMLNMGFKEDLEESLSKTPETKDTRLCSATMPNEVARIAKNYMSSPREITVGTRNSGSENVKHYYYLVHAKDRYLALKRIADYYPEIYSIIFCRTRAETQEVASWLIRDGYSADALHGDLSQAQRDHVMNRFRCKNLQMLVATDVAARGLDVNDLTHVINYNLPDEIEQYTHRSGRTGRANNQGISIAIINLREKGKIRQVEQVIKKRFEQVNIPTGIEVCEKQLLNLIDKLENVNIDYTEIEKFLPQIESRFENMDKNEIVRRFVSLEFNRFIDYYRNAPDLNVSERDERNKVDKKARNVKANQFGMSRLFFNIGHKDKIIPQRLIGLINDTTQSREVVIGKIDIMDTISYVEIDTPHAQTVIEAFHGERYHGRDVIVEPAQPKRGGGKPIEERPRGERSDRHSSFSQKNEHKRIDNERSRSNEWTTEERNDRKKRRAERGFKSDSSSKRSDNRKNNDRNTSRRRSR